ncbi:MAG: hypothetical protein JNJ46_02975 [Myxococcales bacterium]|nr:hypothetical protein [Myxococcales bacterium]
MGLNVAFDCPAGWTVTSGENDDSGAARVVPPGELDACLIIGTRPLYYQPNKILPPEALVDEVLSQQPLFRVVRRSPPEQLQSIHGRLFLVRIVGWHGEPKIAAGQLVTVFVPQDAEVTARAAVAVFMWYTEKAGRKYAPQAMALFRSLRIVSMSQQSWPPSSVLQQFSE